MNGGIPKIPKIVLYASKTENGNATKIFVFVIMVVYA